eukprot:CAMPEP_0177588500 /NCGR_PEP_ID=MMETSP0419_2-20121207/6259_1 /TAXON_ID=582737 /ORGANISM="Tetraselmis sp., Strain GSL018" /LENGTH=512 /DNA_ID=CAMNT_0019078703 /DNA_START=2531 /DNA_END=4068 /DNA_ORIENTATION=-
MLRDLLGLLLDFLQLLQDIYPGFAALLLKVFGPCDQLLQLPGGLSGLKAELQARPALPVKVSDRRSLVQEGLQRGDEELAPGARHQRQRKRVGQERPARPDVRRQRRRRDQRRRAPQLLEPAAVPEALSPPRRARPPLGRAPGALEVRGARSRPVVHEAVVRAPRAEVHVEVPSEALHVAVDDLLRVVRRARGWGRPRQDVAGPEDGEEHPAVHPQALAPVEPHLRGGPGLGGGEHEALPAAAPEAEVDPPWAEAVGAGGAEAPNRRQIVVAVGGDHDRRKVKHKLREVLRCLGEASGLGGELPRGPQLVDAKGLHLLPELVRLGLRGGPQLSKLVRVVVDHVHVGDLREQRHQHQVRVAADDDVAVGGRHAVAAGHDAVHDLELSLSLNGAAEDLELEAAPAAAAEPLADKELERPLELEHERGSRGERLLGEPRGRPRAPARPLGLLQSPPSLGNKLRKRCRAVHPKHNAAFRTTEAQNLLQLEIKLYIKISFVPTCPDNSVKQTAYVDV